MRLDELLIKPSAEIFDVRVLPSDSLETENMSDSGRQIGDCGHGVQREWCVYCLRVANAKLREVLVSLLDMPSAIVADRMIYENRKRRTEARLVLEETK